MAVTHKLIQTITVGAGGAASIEFTSIPGTYTDLVLVSSLRSSNIATEEVLTLSFNNSSANFTSRYIYGSVPATTAVSGSNNYWMGVVGSSGITANVFTSTSLYIPNYAGSTNKSYSVDNTMENNSTTDYPFLVAGLWSQTAAITAIKITPPSGTFVQYSSASLYGIKNS